MTSVKDITENLKMSFVSHMESNRAFAAGEELRIFYDTTETVMNTVIRVAAIL
jgi:hypothetical protein